MTLKIGVFSPSLSLFGGGEFVAIAIANALAQNNYKVVLFTTKKVNSSKIQDFFGETLHSSIKTVEQPTVISSRGLASFYQAILRSYIAKTNCNLLIDPYSNCVYPWTNISYIHFPYLNQYSYNKKFPYIASHHLLEVGSLPYVILEKKLVSYDKKLVIANSQYTAKEIWHYSGEQAEVLYPPFASRILDAGKRTFKDPNENLVVTTSRFEPNKKLERIPLIASQTDPNINFAVIGRLYHKETLNALQRTVDELGLAERVKFYPDLPAENKIELLKRAKIYLHTMVGEHFGISIVEALALGCIPIVHNSGGLKEFVLDQYRYDTIQEAADKITAAVSDWSPEKTEEMKKCSENFSMSNFSTRFMELFSKYYD